MHICMMESGVKYKFVTVKDPFNNFNASKIG